MKMFPTNPAELENPGIFISKKQLHVNFARIAACKESAVPSIQRRLYTHFSHSPKYHIYIQSLQLLTLWCDNSLIWFAIYIIRKIIYYVSYIFIQYILFQSI